MSRRDEASAEDRAAAQADRRVLGGLLVAVTIAFGWILWPFFGTILWGAILGLLFAPFSRRLQRRIGGRPTLAAVLTLLLVLLIGVLPLLVVAGALANEATALYRQLESGETNPGRYLQGLFDALPDAVRALLDRAGLGNFDALRSQLANALAKGSQALASQAFSVGQNTLEFVTSLFIALYLAFFLIRDGEALARAIGRVVPLSPAHKAALLGQFATVVRATVKGNLLVAAIQGALGGLAFWFLDVSGALLWAVLMAFLSLLPAVGAGLVWGPVALYLLLNGEAASGLAMIAWGVLVIGLVDNLLRPLLVGKDTQMADYVVLISTLGGMSVFGLNGFVIGPTIAAMFIAVWQIYGNLRDGTAP